MARQRSWWGWGSEDASPDDDTVRRAAGTIRAQLGFGGEVRGGPGTAGADPPTRAAARRAPRLRGICSISARDLVTCSLGQALRDVVRALRGRVAHLTDVVARARTETAPLIGAWLIVSPWVIRGDVAETSTVLNNVIVGAVAVVFGLAAMGIGVTRSGKSTTSGTSVPAWAAPGNQRIPSTSPAAGYPMLIEHGLCSDEQPRHRPSRRARCGRGHRAQLGPLVVCQRPTPGTGTAARLIPGRSR